MSTSRAKLNNKELDEPTIVKGVEAGKYAWVDLTERDMHQYGKECDEFAKTYTTGANTLYKTQVVSSVLVELIGHAAVVIVGSGLSPGAKTSPKAATQAAQSGVRVGAQRVRGGVERASKTTGPANAAPEPVVEPEVFPDVAARSKM